MDKEILTFLAGIQTARCRQVVLITAIWDALACISFIQYDCSKPIYFVDNEIQVTDMAWTKFKVYTVFITASSCKMIVWYHISSLFYHLSVHYQEPWYALQQIRCICYTLSLQCDIIELCSYLLCYVWACYHKMNYHFFISDTLS